MIKRSLFLMLLLSAFGPAAPSFAGSGMKEYQKGMAQYHKGRYEDALELFQQAIDENLDFWQAFQMAGYCQFRLMHKEAALRSFEESLDIHPGNPSLIKIYQGLKSGTYDVPLRPVASAASYFSRTF